mmetsp:Transcript_10507/g.16091  ORF Transcript_10507/g.16091 Transcript_10507/m.16091 type:complete len:113 (-) Transcript_10507:342-680(-)
MDYYKKEDYKSGVNPFVLGRDYYPSMSFEESQLVNQQIFFKRDQQLRKYKEEEWTLHRIKQVYSEAYLKEDYYMPTEVDEAHSDYLTSRGITREKKKKDSDSDSEARYEELV